VRDVADEADRGRADQEASEEPDGAAVVLHRDLALGAHRRPSVTSCAMVLPSTNTTRLASTPSAVRYAIKVDTSMSRKVLAFQPIRVGQRYGSCPRAHLGRGLPAAYRSSMRRGGPLGLPGERSSAKFLCSLTRLLVNQVRSYLLHRQRTGHCL
jgi:hypothetical protein